MDQTCPHSHRQHRSSHVPQPPSQYAKQAFPSNYPTYKVHRQQYIPIFLVKSDISEFIRATGICAIVIETLQTTCQSRVFFCRTCFLHDGKQHRCCTYICAFCLNHITSMHDRDGRGASGLCVLEDRVVPSFELHCRARSAVVMESFEGINLLIAGRSREGG